MHDSREAALKVRGHLCHPLASDSAWPVSFLATDIYPEQNWLKCLGSLSPDPSPSTEQSFWTHGRTIFIQNCAGVCHFRERESNSSQCQHWMKSVSHVWQLGRMYLVATGPTRCPISHNTFSMGLALLQPGAIRPSGTCIYTHIPVRYPPLQHIAQ